MYTMGSIAMAVGVMILVTLASTGVRQYIRTLMKVEMVECEAMSFIGVVNANDTMEAYFVRVGWTRTRHEAAR